MNVGAIAAVVGALAGVIESVLATPLRYWIDKRALRHRLETEYEFEERRKLRQLIGSYHGRMLEHGDDWSRRMKNIYERVEAGDLKLDAGGNYAELDYYLRTTAYRFLSLCAIARQFETEAFYIDARIAEARDLEFLKFVKALRWAMTDLELVEGVVTQGDNFFNDELRMLCDLCLNPTGKVITLTEFSSRAASESDFGLVLRYFDGLRPDEQRLRWDRLVAFHLIVMAFVNSIGYDMQQADDERFARTAGQLRNRRVAENLAKAIPRLGLGASPEAQRIVRALPGDLGGTSSTAPEAVAAHV